MCGTRHPWHTQQNPRNKLLLSLLKIVYDIVQISWLKWYLWVIGSACGRNIQFYQRKATSNGCSWRLHVLRQNENHQPWSDWRKSPNYIHSVNERFVNQIFIRFSVCIFHKGTTIDNWINKLCKTNLAHYVELSERRSSGIVEDFSSLCRCWCSVKRNTILSSPLYGYIYIYIYVYIYIYIYIVSLLVYDSGQVFLSLTKGWISLKWWFNFHYIYSAFCGTVCH